MPKYLGRGQIAICKRCGFKFKASELVFDGREPMLLVCGGCWDPAHPQERPYIPDDVEGVPRFKPSPENFDDTPPVLTGEPDEETQTTIELSWTLADRAAGPTITSYILYRDGVVLTTIEVDYSDPLVDPLETLETTYTDSDVEAGETYVYTVVASTDNDLLLTSNTVTIEMPDPIVNPELTAELAGLDIQLTWTALTGIAPTGYTLYRDDVEIFSGTDLSFLDEDVDPGTTYVYRVDAMAGEDGPFSSNVAQQTTPAALLSPTLSGELLVGEGSSDIELEWTAVVGADEYELWRSINGGAYEMIADQVGLTYTDEDVGEDSIYGYYVIAHDELQQSNPSNTVLIDTDDGVTIDLFTPGESTWIKRDGLVSADITGISGGGGGAGGGGGPNSLRSGGGAGGGGYFSFSILAAFLGATEDVVVGEGGLGGAPVQSSSGGTPGNAGANGGTTSFGAWASATGGVGGKRNGGTGTPASSAGGVATVTGSPGPTSVVEENGGIGRVSSPSPPGSTTFSGAGGGEAAAAGGTPEAGGTADFSGSQFFGGNGGDGGLGAQNSNDAQPGEDGDDWGGGGGGGGAAGQSLGQGPFDSAAGGEGGPGILVVVNHFE